MPIFKKIIFTATIIAILFLLVFIKTATAAIPPGMAGCSDSYEIFGNPEQYQGYYYCKFSNSGCPGTALGWKVISRTEEPLNSHGCNSPDCDPCALGPSCCAVTGILWEQIPTPVCTIAANPIEVFSGETSTISWTINNVLSGTISDGTTTTTLTSAQIIAKNGSFTTLSITGNITYNMAVEGDGGLSATCGPVSVGLITPPTGGLIPCGRLADNPLTGDIDESKPCSICAMFYLLKNIVNFIMSLSIGIGVFILVIAGLLYAFSAGNPRNIELAKSAITNVIIGLSIIFIAWMVIAVILQGLGYANMSTWNQVNCALPT